MNAMSPAIAADSDASTSSPRPHVHRLSDVPAPGRQCLAETPCEHNPDAELLNACAEFGRLMAEERDLDPIMADIDKVEESERAHDYWDSVLMERVDEIVDLLIARPARTQEGCRAKVEIARVWLDRKVASGLDETFDDASEPHKKLAMSALQDVLAGDFA